MVWYRIAGVSGCSTLGGVDSVCDGGCVIFSDASGRGAVVLTVVEVSAGVIFRTAGCGVVVLKDLSRRDWMFSPG